MILIMQKQIDIQRFCIDITRGTRLAGEELFGDGVSGANHKFLHVGTRGVRRVEITDNNTFSAKAIL